MSAEYSEEITQILRELYNTLQGVGWSTPVLLQAAKQIEKLEAQKGESLRVLSALHKGADRIEELEMAFREINEDDWRMQPEFIEGFKKKYSIGI